MVKNQVEDGAYTNIEALLSLRYIAKDLSLQTRKKSVAMMDGDSRTSFRGRGMEFSEVRPYQAGDDIRNIDWRVTARTQKPYTKLFQEERERPVYILVDQRAPMFFGSVNEFKSVHAAKLAAIIGWTALANNDRIGALIFSDCERTDSRARRGKHAVLELLHQLFAYNQKLTSPVYSAENITDDTTQRTMQERVEQAKQYAPFSEDQSGRKKTVERNTLESMIKNLRRVAKPGSAVFIISDFHDFTDSCSEPLSMLARHTDTTMVQIFDTLEQVLPLDKSLSLSNGGQRLNIAGQSREFSEAFTQSFEQNRCNIRQACNKTGVSFTSISTADTIEDVAADLFTSRNKSRKRPQAKLQSNENSKVKHYSKVAGSHTHA